MKISVVVPIYLCRSTLIELYDRLVCSLSKITSEFEIILVNDACPQGSWDIISYLSDKDKRVVGINLSRNFGQHIAITAGLNHAEGDWVVVMDGDLQDPPEEISKLYDYVQNGYDVVFARRHERKDNFFKRLRSKLFIKVFDFISKSKTDPATNTFCICNKKVIDSFRKMREQNRSFPLFIRWLGFEIGSINVKHLPRGDGKSSYSVRKLVKLALDYISISSNRPLIFSIILGFIISTGAFICAVFLVFGKVFFFKVNPGWTSIMVSIYLVGGLIITNLGILGFYIGKIFDETRRRPLYLIKDIKNKKTDHVPE